jgi:hypothetical protein
LEAAGTFSGFNAYSCDSIENHSWDASAACWATARCWASEVHVGACGLTVGTMVPDLIGWANLVSHAIVMGTFPESTGACASIALIFTWFSILVVGSFESALAVNDWDALQCLFINRLSLWTVASSEAFFHFNVWLNLSACLSAGLGTLLVHLTSNWASYGAFSVGSPVIKNNSGKGAFMSVGGEDWTLTVSNSICPAGAGTHVLFAHGDETSWIENGVARLEDLWGKNGALFPGELEVLCVLRAW